MNASQLQLLQELAQLRRRVSVLEERLAQRPITWLSAAEMAQHCGLNKRTLLRYANEGRLSENAFRKTRRGTGTAILFRFHRERTLEELGMI